MDLTIYEYLIPHLLVGVALAEVCHRERLKKEDLYLAGHREAYLATVVLWPLLIALVVISKFRGKAG